MAENLTVTAWDTARSSWPVRMCSVRRPTVAIGIADTPAV